MSFDNSQSHWTSPELYEWDPKTENLIVTGSKWGGPEEIMILEHVNLDNIDLSNPKWKDYYEYEGE